MASEDIIELGSSDEETEHVPKKRKTIPNAMVHIPIKNPGLTIKSNIRKSPEKSIGSKAILIKPAKAPPTVLPNIQIFKNIMTSPSQFIKNKQMTRPKSSINPLKFAKNSQLAIKKILPYKQPSKVQGSIILNNLPPSITVKKTKSQKLVQFSNISEVKKLQNSLSNRGDGDVLTVNLDDDPVSETACPLQGSLRMTNPQWYLTPEQAFTKDVSKANDTHKVSIEQEDISMEQDVSMEQVNNKEPTLTKYVEITIEDSPIKVQNDNDIDVAHSITIEDSPIKPDIMNNKIVEKISKPNKYENIPNSKKKLNYPKVSHEDKVFEIEIDAIASTPLNIDDKSSDVVLANSAEALKPTTITNEKKNATEIKVVNKEAITSSHDVKSDGNSASNDVTYSPSSEFHPVYQSFIDTCFKLENSVDMHKIVEKKIKTYYRQCTKNYVESESFIELVSSKIAAMQAGPHQMYLFIKDVVDELNLQRKLAKSSILNKAHLETESEDKNKEESEYDSKRERQIRKLEKTIKKLHRAIQKLEEQEVDFDDEDDSVYLLTERYKERMVRVYAKFCQLTNTKLPSEPKFILEAQPDRPTAPVKKLEKWINKKVPGGTPFPDFHDVLRCVREANEEDKLGWNEIEIKDEATNLFLRCGKKLQRRRQEIEWRIASSRIPSGVDPPENDEELKVKLNNNKVIAAKKESELFKRFVDRQDQLKLVAEEIGDIEAEESPIESEDDEVIEASHSMEHKQRRKDRLSQVLGKNKKANQKLPLQEEENNEKNKKESILEIPEAPIENEQISIQDTTDIITEKDLTKTEVLQKDQNKELSNMKVDNVKDTDIEEIGLREDNLIQTVSDNSLDSNIDELHLLQKSHSGTEVVNSSSESMDFESPIATSDTISDSDALAISEDVISIENSSYSETETNTNVKNNNDVHGDQIECLVSPNLEISNSDNEVEMEKILLASSSDEEQIIEIDKSNNMCINPYDDSLSLTEVITDANESIEIDLNKGVGSESNEVCVNMKDKKTCMEDVTQNNENDNNQETVIETLETSINLKDDLISITETNVEAIIVEKSTDEIIPVKRDIISVTSNKSPNKDQIFKNNEICINMKDLDKKACRKDVTQYNENDINPETENKTLEKSINMKDDLVCITETAVESMIVIENNGDNISETSDKILKSNESPMCVDNMELPTAHIEDLNSIETTTEL